MWLKIEVIPYYKEKLKYWKISVYRIPHTLTANNVPHTSPFAKKNFTGFWKEGNTFLDHIVTSDESWYHCYIPTSKQCSLTWEHKNLPHATKTRLKTLARKVILILFFDISGPVLIEWMSKSTTINAARYIDTLMKLHINIKNRRERICRNRAVAGQHKTAHGRTDIVDVDDTEIQGSYASSIQSWS